ncbi:Na+/H+ antiporter [Paenibacillus kobensis]|uniref:Na+/H+ antiporter n=1 Tax=Paenibacillus kobensis TaxID=59841 RepID=UPI000FDAAAFD|nr:Na+/H+ antiporter [Paenibacillus kobensis]
MTLFLMVLVLLSLLAVSQIVNRIVPAVPVPIIQIALGALVTIAPWQFDLAFHPELFFILFIAPLLFSDGKRTPRQELWQLRLPILLLAVGLVFATVLVGGLTIHALIPTIPLAAAFGLAAILSPTDAVAVSAIAARAQLPQTIHRLLEGESLMNDASGLVAFKFAIAAAVTGVFSLWQASISFIVISLGGLVAGALLSLAIIWIRVMLRRFGMEDVTVHVLIQLLTPFVLYYIAEHFGLSGILAAVAGGIVHAVEQDRTRYASLELKVVSESTWSVMLFIMNGLVFVLLGLQIPDVIYAILHDPAHNSSQSFGYALLLYGELIALRFVWLLSSVRLTWPLFRHSEKKENIHWKSLAVMSVSGVRGALTLAGAFTIPLVLNNGSAFPERNLILFLAACVIILSLAGASIALPVLTRTASRSMEGAETVEREAELQCISAAMRAVKQAGETNQPAVAAVLLENERRVAAIQRNKAMSQDAKQYRQQELAMRRLGVEKEKQYIEGLLEKGELREEEADVLLTILNHIQLSLTSHLRVWGSMFAKLFRRLIATFVPFMRPEFEPLTHVRRAGVIKLRLRSAEAAIEALRKERTGPNRAAAARVVHYYKRMTAELMKQLGSEDLSECSNEALKELELLCVQAERDELRQLFQQGKLTRKQLNKLQMQASIREADIMDKRWGVPELEP